MDLIVAEILKILKSGKNSIQLEEDIVKLKNKIFENALVRALELMDDELFVNKKKQGYKSERKDARTIQGMFGAITFKRRLMHDPNGKATHPLDQVMGWEPNVKNTHLIEEFVARLVAQSVYRGVERSFTLLTDLSMSHAQVGAIVKKAGIKCTNHEKYLLRDDTKEVVVQRVPKVLHIEGDGLTVKQKAPGKCKKSDLHRICVYEGVIKNGNRHILDNCICFSDTDREVLFDQVERYLDKYYDLRHTLVIANSDGGSGYRIDDFKELVVGCGRYEYFIDRFHVNKKIKERLKFANEIFQDQFRQALYSYDIIRVNTMLDTALAMAQTAEDEENVELLRKYVKRNWLGLEPAKHRGLGVFEGIGTCESGHRIYSYRMKHQGRSWGAEGEQAIAKIITAIKNNTLREAILNENKAIVKVARDTSRAAARALKKVNVPHVGVIKGNIANYGPTSSPMGKLVKSFATVQNF